MPASPPPVSAPRGRPRRDGAPAGEDVAGEILRAAYRLFSEHGYEQVSVSQIARAVGLSQSSLYYYFRNKDAVLAALIADGDLVPNARLDAIVADGGSAAVRLYRFVHGDVLNLCRHPFDLGGLQRAAQRDPEAFASYRDQVAEIEDALRGIVRAGVSAGELRAVDPDLVVVTLLTSAEGAQSRFLVGSRFPAEAVARQVADLVVGGLLVDPGRIDAVRAEAERLDAGGG